MQSARFPISPEGHAKLEAELQRFKTVERPAVIKAIAEARAHGDLSENAEYHAAKERQGFIEAKIKDLDYKLSTSQIIDVKTIVSDQVQFGATVTLKDEETDEKVTYSIVSEFEADTEHKKISTSSPLARAMMGKKAGESIEVSTPKGSRYYEILAIKFG